MGNDKHIVVKPETFTRLQNIAKYGDTMDDVINKILDYWGNQELSIPSITKSVSIPDGYISLKDAQANIVKQWHKNVSVESIKNWAAKDYLTIAEIDGTVIINKASLEKMFRDCTL